MESASGVSTNHCMGCRERFGRKESKDYGKHTVIIVVTYLLDAALMVIQGLIIEYSCLRLHQFLRVLGVQETDAVRLAPCCSSAKN